MPETASLDQYHKEALKILTGPSGAAEPSGIMQDSYIIEQNLPLIYQLQQIRILLILGRTLNSSDVHLSSINELEKVILEVDLHSLEEDERPVVSEASIGKQSFVRIHINLTI